MASSAAKRIGMHVWARRAIATRAGGELTGGGGGKKHWGVSVVQGGSRGIGLQMVRELLSRGGDVVATSRHPQQSIELVETERASGGRLMLIQMDTTSEASIERAALEVRQRHERVDLLVNVSGLLHGPDGFMPETSLDKVTADSLLRTYQTNAMGPVLVAKHFMSMLSNRGKEEDVAVLASISARVGSISDNSLGGWYSYRASKAGLNMLMKNVSLEVVRRKRPVANILLHPGTVDTDLSKPFQRNVPKGKLFTREQCVEYLLKIIDNTSPKDNGRFYAWDGSEIPF